MRHNGRANGMWSRSHLDSHADTIPKTEPADFALILMFIFGLVLFVVPHY
jgi:hypothetical protein